MPKIRNSSTQEHNAHIKRPTSIVWLNFVQWINTTHNIYNQNKRFRPDRHEMRVFASVLIFLFLIYVYSLIFLFLFMFSSLETVRICCVLPDITLDYWFKAFKFELNLRNKIACEMCLLEQWGIFRFKFHVKVKNTNGSASKESKQTTTILF